MARWVHPGLRDLQLLERCIADDVEAGASVNLHVVELDVGDSGSADERKYTGPRHVFRAVGRPK